MAPHRSCRCRTAPLVLCTRSSTKGGTKPLSDRAGNGVWPWFEKIGGCIVGKWRVIHPGGSSADPEFDDGYALARYTSYVQWKATRRGHLLLGGNGPGYERNRESLRARSHYAAGPHGASCLGGVTASTRTYCMPALGESHEAVESVPAIGPRPARIDINWPDREIIALDRWKADKGVAEDFVQAGVDKVWPYLGKVGARIVGQRRADSRRARITTGYSWCFATRAARTRGLHGSPRSPR